MESADQNISAAFLCGIILASSAVSLLWQALLHKVWGAKVLKEAATARAVYLKTNVGEFRIDKVHKKFNSKAKGEAEWQSVDFDHITKVSIDFTNDTASWLEFLVSDWSIWDLSGKYRDVLNTYTIQVELYDRRVVPFMHLKQFEQREWLLGALFLAITIGILKYMRMYRDAEDVANEKRQELEDKLRKMGLPLP